MAKETAKTAISFEDFKREILNDYRIANESREASLLGRKEVLTGKAKFGIFGDGKEIAQVALAKQFRDGDFRSGYYRDQTMMMASGNLTIQQFFAQLYAHPDIEHDPHSGGRQMNAHFATRSLNPDGSWKNLTKMKNTAADLSPTGSQMPRLLGLAYASKFYRENKSLKQFSGFSNKGNEVAFGTIGDSSTSEGMFFETVNAAGVLQVPMVLSVWDDGHGISVSKKYQTTKENISEILEGFRRTKKKPGYEIFNVNGWDYPALCETYQTATNIAREEHVPVLIHVDEVTQPQGHSTSGSHERYKSKERLQWEQDFDPIKKMREWMLKTAIAAAEELDKIEEEAKQSVKEAQKAAWSAFQNSVKKELREVNVIVDEIIAASDNYVLIEKIKNMLNAELITERRNILAAVKKIIRLVSGENSTAVQRLKTWIIEADKMNFERYNTHLYSESALSPLNVKPVNPVFEENSKTVDGRVVLRDNFDKILEKNPEALIFGEDSGKIGGVNQGLEGLQEKYGDLRVFDTGIRECTIIGQAIGLAMRGLRPIAEIQYLDYLLYAIQILSDDLATLRYRTMGGQKAPVIIRTRGHRLEGIWHSGSPMGIIVHALRGLHVCVPRNMTQAAGFYNMLLAGDDPGLIIESLNGYRLKEQLPSNIGEFKVPLGIPEIITEGEDVTVVTYGSMVRMAVEAANQLMEADISAEIIDVQTLLPFDINHLIVESIKKTNRVLFLDEDVPGGASAYMMQQVLEEHEGYYFLDAAPKTLTSKSHRPAYGSDGDYFSKPSVENIFDAVYELMQDADPVKYPGLY